MGLQVNIIEYSLDRPGTDRYNDPVSHGLARQVFTGPVGDVQSLGQGFQAGQFDNLSALEGGKSWPVAPNVPSGRRRVGQQCHWFHTDGRLSKPWLHRTGIDRPRPRFCCPLPVLKRSERVAPETTAGPGSERSATAQMRRRDERKIDWVFGRAMAGSLQLTWSITTSLAMYANFVQVFCPETLASSVDASRRHAAIED